MSSPEKIVSSPQLHLASQKSSCLKSNKKKKSSEDETPLVINIMYTQYEVIHEVAEECNMRTTDDETEDWDLWFIDNPVIPALLQRMKSY